MKRSCQKRLKKVRRLPRSIRRRAMRGKGPRRCFSYSLSELRAEDAALDELCLKLALVLHAYFKEQFGGVRGPPVQFNREDYVVG